MFLANTFKNNNKEIISDNDTAGHLLPINAISIMQRVFGSSGLLGTTQLALTSGFNVLQAYKTALAFKRM